MNNSTPKIITTKKIGSTEYIVTAFFESTAKENAAKKMRRIILADFKTK